MNVGRDAVLAGGLRNLAPERPPVETMRGTEGPAQSGARETRKRTDTTMARRKTRTHPTLMRQTRRFRVARRNPGRSGEIRNMRLSARHPPRLRRERERDYGRTPAPSKQQGPQRYGCLTIE